MISFISRLRSGPLAKRFGFKLTGEAGVRLLSTIFILLLARKIGARTFGQYSSAFAFAALFTIVVDLGTNPILIREIARSPAQRNALLNSSHLLKLMMSLIAWILIHITSHFFTISRDKVALVDALGIVVINYTLTEYFSALLAGKNEMGWEAVQRIVSRSLCLSGGFLMLFLNRPLEVIAYAMAIGSLLSYAASFFLIRYRFGGFSYEFNWCILKKLMTNCLPILGSVIFWIFYDNQDILMLNHFHVPDIQIGWYAAANKLIDVLRAFPVLLTGVYFPSLSLHRIEGRDLFVKVAKSLLRYMFLSALLLMSLLYWLAPWCIRLLYGMTYGTSSILLRFLLPAFPGICLNHVLFHLLVAQDHERRAFWGAIVACLSNLLLGWLLIPKLSVTGVCLSLFGSESLYFLFQYRLLCQVLPEVLPFKA